jgi:chromosomal replication initiation ATPase DnaA
MPSAALGSASEYSFETFVIGSNNWSVMACGRGRWSAAARAYNPFRLRRLGPGQDPDPRLSLKVRYVSLEEFTNDLINMIRAATTPPSSTPTGRSAP